MIQRYPETFGLAERDVAGASIPALASIAEELIKDGWTRYRPWSGLYVFEVDNARRRIDLVERILVDADAFEGEQVKISQARPRRQFDGFVSEVFDRTIFRYQENPYGNKWRFS